MRRTSCVSAMIGARKNSTGSCYRLVLTAARRTSALETYTAFRRSTSASAPSRSSLARRMAAGDETTTWFERHGSTPITEIPSHWPEDYRQVVQRRIDLIERDRNIGLIERPEYKRRWNTPAWEDLEQAALRDWLLDRLEAPHLWPASADHAAADHHHQPPGRRGARRRRLHADRRAVRRPRRLRPQPTRGRTGRRRIGALPARAALHRHRPAQARAVGRHLGAAAARRRRRERSARFPCRPSTRARTS